MIRYDQTGQWPSSRRCGYVLAYFAKRSKFGGTDYVVGATDGKSTSYRHMPSDRSKCPRTYSVSSTYGDWSAVCLSNYAIDNPLPKNTCPKGWGNARRDYPDDYYSVQNAQGYAKTGQLPVYGYVTRYNTKYYNYFAGRVSKA